MNNENKSFGDDDINEILEHTLHTLHRFGVRGGVQGSTEALNIEAEEEDITNTDVFLAMKEAYTNGVFDIEGYGGDINNRDADPDHPANDGRGLLKIGRLKHDFPCLGASILQ